MNKTRELQNKTFFEYVNVIRESSILWIYKFERNKFVFSLVSVFYTGKIATEMWENYCIIDFIHRQSFGIILPWMFHLKLLNKSHDKLIL